jgi:protein-disulfide isomerase
MPETITPRQPASSWRAVFEVSATVLMVALAAALVWEDRSRFVGARSPKSLVVPRDPIATSGRPTRGVDTARVAIVEYTDFQCPFCGAVAKDTLMTLVRDYVDTGKVILIFKSLPLSIHPLAQGAAVAALCAGEQLRFWQMHDLLFARQSTLADQDLRAAASEVGLDLRRYDSCRSEGSPAKVIKADASEAAAFGITATPTFLFGTVQPDGRVRATDVLVGARPVADFRAILDRSLGGK